MPRFFPSGEGRVRPLLFFIIFFVIFHRFWAHSIIDRDSFQFFAPNKYLLESALRQGKILAWYPWQFLGMPFVADLQSGWFYPLNLVYLVLPFEPAHRLFILLHYPMAALGLDLFLRGRKVEPRVSLVAALAFPLCGYMICQHSNLAYLIGPALAPYALAAHDRSLRGPRRWAVGTGAVLALQILGGEPQSAFITAVLVALIGLGHSWSGARRGSALLAVAVAGGAALLLSAAQLLPSFEMWRASVRAGGLTLPGAAIFSFHPGRVLELIWPWPFGTFWPDFNFFGWFASDLAPGRAATLWSGSDYLGLPLIFLAAIGLIFSRRSERVGAALALLGFFLLALGLHTPVFGWLFRLFPPLRLFRYPEKYLPWVSLFLCVASAFGLETIRDWSNSAGPRLVRAFLTYVILAAAVAGLAAIFWPGMMERMSHSIPGGILLDSARAQFQDSLRQFLGINLATAFILFLLGRGWLRFPRAVLGLAAVMVLDWTLASVAHMPAGPPDIFDFRPLAAQAISPSGRPPLGEFRVFKETMSFRDPNPDLAAFTQLERLRIWQRNTLERNLDVMEGFEDLVGYNSSVLLEGQDLLFGELTPDLLELYNVRYLIAAFDRPPLTSVPAELVLRDPKNDLAIYRLPGAWPRAYWVGQALAAPDEKSARALLKTADLKKNVILTTTEQLPAGSDQRTLAPARIVSYEPDEVKIECGTDGPGWLVLSDRFYPGWRAEVAGRPAVIYKANLMVRAVALPPGRHTVVFSYRPLSLRAGLLVSALAWAAALAGAIFFRARGQTLKI